AGHLPPGRRAAAAPLGRPEADAEAAQRAHAAPSYGVRLVMPLVRVSVLRGKPREFRRQVGDAIHRAMVETIAVPPLDRFQVITEHEAGELVYDANYLGIKRTDDIVVVQLTITSGRTLAMKRRLYAAIADNLAGLGVRREDVWINLVEVAKENW